MARRSPDRRILPHLDRGTGVAATPHTFDEQELRMKTLIAASAFLAVLALPVLARAQDVHHAGKSPKTDLHVSTSIVVGTTTLKEGNYTFQFSSAKALAERDAIKDHITQALARIRGSSPSTPAVMSPAPAATSPPSTDRFRRLRIRRANCRAPSQARDVYARCSRSRRKPWTRPTRLTRRT